MKKSDNPLFQSTCVPNLLLSLAVDAQNLKKDQIKLNPLKKK